MQKLLIYTIILIEKYNIENISFNDWVSAKSRINKFILRLAIRKLNNNNYKKINYSYRFYNYVIFIKIYLKIRTLLIFKIIPLKIRVYIFLLMIYFVCVFKLVKSFKHLFYSYQFPSDEKSISACINFPEHSFSISNKNYISSFGEYLACKKINDIISLDEYKRPSLANEIYKHQSINRKKIRKSISFHTLTHLFKSPKIKINNIIFFIKSPLLSILLLSDFFYQFKYIVFFEKLISSNKVNNIYVLPFVNYFYLHNNKNISNHLVVFNYAENFLLPPASTISSEIYNKNDLLKVMESYSINIFQYYGISEGYTEVTKNFNLFKLKLNKYFNSSFEIQDNFRPNIPCFLAYEKSTINLNSDYLLIFDVPPESNIVQLQQNFIGDRVASYDFNKKFLCDIVEVASNLKLKIVLKPKYSLNNYSEEYKSLLSYLQNNFGLNILNPYVRASSIINNANSVISAPYTSTESFAKYVSIRSCFYVPDSYNFHKEFSSVINSSIIITGRESLRQFLIS